MPGGNVSGFFYVLNVYEIISRKGKQNWLKKGGGKS